MSIMDGNKFKNPKGYTFDFELLKTFENGLNLIDPDRSQIPGRVLGYGEISTVFEIQTKTMSGLAFKRMSIFESMEELDAYLFGYEEYNRILQEEIGINLPAHGYAVFMNKDVRPIFYIIQEKLPVSGIGNKLLHSLDAKEISALFELVMRELLKVWRFNRENNEIEMGIDGQISNWVIKDFGLNQRGLDDATRLVYIDTSTPMLRNKGVEQMNSELFLRSAPSFLSWILKIFFLEDVVGRYYDFRKVVIDLLANCYKEQRSDLVPDLLSLANNFFENEAKDFGLALLHEKEVRDYYKEDALIWTLYLSMRRLDRFIHRYILRRTYPYLLPGRIKR